MLRRRLASPAPLPAFRTLLRASALLAVLALAGACAPVAATAQVGYARLRLGGEITLGAGDAPQDVGSAFGLGSEDESAYVRVLATCGVPEFGITAFQMSEEGTGVLDGSFGGLPAGTTVDTRLRLGVAKLTAAAALHVGPVTVSPGALFDVVAIDFRASNGGNREEVNDVVVVPMPFVRAVMPFGAFVATAEVGWIDPPSFIDINGRFADVEALLEWRAHSSLGVVAGYRFVSADATGVSGTGDVDLDLQVSGWFVGGSVRF
jgi:hypothetical protein